MKYSIDQIKEMLGKISPWPWQNIHDFIANKNWPACPPESDLKNIIIWKEEGLPTCQDMEFLAAAPTIISDLLEQLEEDK